MEESKELRIREPKLRHFVAGAVLSGISVLVVLAWIGRPRSDPFDDDGTAYLVELAVLPILFGCGFAGFVRWLTDIEFRRCLRANLIALGFYVFAGLVIEVIWCGSIDGEYGPVLGNTVAVVASYYGLGAFLLSSLLMAVGSGLGYGFSNYGRRFLDRRSRFDPH
jgi:hypothetical protein